MKLPKEFYWYGSEHKLPESTGLTAGPLTMDYESGNLRYLQLGSQEVLRMIYSAVRDHNWDTIAPVISNEQISSDQYSFSIRYDADYRQDQLHFKAHYEINGLADGTVEFYFEGSPETAFLKNRIGFCILHPVEPCAGKNCLVEHVDGTTEEIVFPETISPHQPVKNIRKFRWKVNDQVTALLEFEGDIFEMEDQRNWTDASYKTYCTPLEKPFPVQVEPGEVIRQRVRLSFEGKPEMEPSRLDSHPELIFSGNFKPWPEVGIARSSERDLLRSAEIELIRQLRFRHYRVDLFLDDHTWKEIFRNATEEYINFRFPLEIILHFGEDAENQLLDFINFAKELSPYMKTITIFQKNRKVTPLSLISMVVPVLRGRFPDILVGAGTDAYFTEFNREWEAPEELDYISYSINPQVHAFDNASLTETLQAQAYTVESARKVAHDLPVHISPVTLKPRFNPNTTGPELELPEGEMPPQVDLRQMSLFGAGWTAVSIKYLAESGARSITYFETIGRRGIIQGVFGPEEEQPFRVEADAVFPVYFVFREILSFYPKQVEILKSSSPLEVDALMLEKDGERKLLVVNFKDKAVKFSFLPWKGKLHRRLLSDKNVEGFMYRERWPEEELMKKPAGSQVKMELPPYGIAVIY